MPQLQFAIDHGVGRSSVGRGSEVINAFAQQAPKGSQNPVFLLGTPGTDLFCSLVAGEKVVALQPAFGKLIAITERSVYVVDNTGVKTRIGAGLSSGIVDTAFNGIVVVAVDGISAIEITETTVTTIIDPNFHKSNSVDFIDGYLVFQRNGTGEFFIAGPYSTVFDPLDFATAESAPDKLVAVVAVGSHIWLMGEESTEAWVNQGGLFPFVRVSGVSITYGCAAAGSARRVDQSVVWLSNDGIVYQTNGYQPLRISTHEIEEEIKALSDGWNSALAWAYIEDGHQFYALTIDDATFVFDFATRLWHKRASVLYGRHAANCSASMFGKTLIGDDDGNILVLSRDHLTEYGGGEIVTILGSILYSNGGEYFSVDRFMLDCEVGAGGDAAAKVSKDGGKTYGNLRYTKVGELGKHKARVQWRRLGAGYNMLVQVQMSGSVRRRIGSIANIEVS